MRRIALFTFYAIVAASLSGCGGGVPTIGNNQGFGEVAGNVVDINGNTVQNAVVRCQGQTTRTNTGGAFVLRDVPVGTWRVTAESSPNSGSQTYSAQSVIQIFQDERSRNVNLTLVRQDQQATLFGVVRDRFGFVLQGAKVFAFIESGGTQLASCQDVTNGLGEFEIKGLAAGYTYIVNGSARGFSSDRGTVVLSSGQRREWNITVGDAADPFLSPPANLTAVAWTTPAIGTLRGATTHPLAYEALKRRYDPARAERKSRSVPTDTTALGNNIEVDASWNFPTTNLQYLLGYGIYRATSAVGVSTGIDFLRDPETNFYADLSDDLLENTNYYYEATALNVNFPDTGNSESNFSDRYGVRTLSDLLIDPITTGPVTFHWRTGSGATEFFVYVFDESPTIGTVEIYRNATAVGGTSHVYPNSAPALISGHHYYYMILGLANGGDSRTISALGDFIAN